MELIKENPHKAAADPFIFYGLLEDKPMDIQFLIDGLRGACREVGNNPAGWTVNPAATEGADTGPDIIWMIQGEKNAKGELRGTWSDPVRYKRRFGQMRTFPQNPGIIILKSDTSGIKPNRNPR
jgi:hypothetical protein